MKFKHIFGPVPSRRLGISLGIDIVEPKTCNLNCLYCECGITTNHTNCRKEYVNAKNIIEELNLYLQNERNIDYITFSGAGEPLLHSKISDIVNFLKLNFPQYKLALITNGVLLLDKQVQNQIRDIDLIIPSLDAATKEIFKRINRPHKDINFDNYIQSLINLKNYFSGDVWLEIFFIHNLNDSEAHIEKLKNIIDKISPHKIQLNTIDRPPAEKGITGVSYDNLMKIKNFFGKKAEIIKSFRNKKIIAEDKINLISNCLKRRPLTMNDLTAITSLKIQELNKILDILKNEGKLEVLKENRGIFYRLK